MRPPGRKQTPNRTKFESKSNEAAPGRKHPDQSGARGTPSELKSVLMRERGLTEEPTLDDVFLDATGRTRERVAGEVQEVR